MSDERSDRIFGLIVAFGLGFVAAIILIKREPAQQSLQQSKTQRKYGFMDGSTDNPLANWRPLGRIPDVSAIADGTEPLQQLPIIPVEVQEAQSESSGTTHYKNSEKWKVIRNENNRIVGYELDRDANIG